MPTPLLAPLMGDVTAVDWNDLPAVDKLLRALDEDCSMQRHLADADAGTPGLVRLCEHYDILDKIVLATTRPGGGCGYTCSCPATSTDRTTTAGPTPAALTPRMVRTEQPGDTYTLHHSMIHSVVAEPYTVSLIVRGPAATDRFAALTLADVALQGFDDLM